MTIYRINIISWSNPEEDRQAIFLTEASYQQYVDETIKNLHGEQFLITAEKADIPAWNIRQFRNWLLFGVGKLDDLDLVWEALEVITANETN